MTVKEIVAYLKDLEEDLYCQEFTNETTLTLHLNKTTDIIKQIMELTEQESDPDRRSQLAAVEYKARECRKYIASQLPPLN